MFVVHTFMCLQINCIYSHQQLHAIMQTNIDTLLYFFQPWIQFLTGLQYVSSGVGSDESLHFALHIAEKKRDLLLKSYRISYVEWNIHSHPILLLFIVG